MTRCKWTTEEQRQFLEPHVDAFFEANQRKAAAKDFFPNVVPKFIAKWPCPSVTQAEVADAGGNQLMAERAKLAAYEKRIRDWFHNKNRSLQQLAASGSMSHSVLKVTAPPMPKKLQPWQAYHALTYESMWKPHVNKAWTDYKETWHTEHPDMKPEKTRFQVMVEFMKQRFAEASGESKQEAEEYRVRQATQVLEDTGLKQNQEYQTAIEMLPRTLLTIGESLQRQTGWHFTILAGGPLPQTGAIVSLLSHTGENKLDENYAKFLGTKPYDEHVLRPFERFLNSAFSDQDCLKRKLSQPKPASEDGNGDDEVYNEQMKKDAEREEANEREGEAEKEKGKGKEKQKEGEGEERSKEERSKKDKENVPPQLSEYELLKEKNLAENKLILEKLKEQYPIPNELGKKKTTSKPASTVQRQRKENEEKEESNHFLRSKVDSVVPPTSTLPESRPLTPNAPVAPITTASEVTVTLTDPPTPTTSIPLGSSTVPTKSAEPSIAPAAFAIQAVSALDNTGNLAPSTPPRIARKSPSLPHQINHIHNVCDNSTPSTPILPSERMISPDRAFSKVSSLSEVFAKVVHEAIQDIDSDIPNVGAPQPIPIPSDASDLPVSPQSPPNLPQIPSSGTPNSGADSTGIASSSNETVETPGSASGLAGLPVLTPINPEQSAPSVPMTDITALIPINDSDLPSSLIDVIPHLRSVSVENTWQNLVTRFIEFEKGGPPSGNLTTKHRPQEISDWIRNKRKQLLVPVDRVQFGGRWVEWWTGLQPGWRTTMGTRDAPDDETWASLRKGGKSGFLIVVMALSWWIAAQSTEHLADAWTAVDDMSWVLEKMLGRSPSPIRGEKRASDGDLEGQRTRKSRRRA